MREHARRQPQVDLGGRVQHQVLAQETEHRLEQQRQHHAEREHVQRRIGLVDQHLVDHELEKYRQRQRPIPCSTSAAITTSRNNPRWRSISGTNQRRPNGCFSSASL